MEVESDKIAVFRAEFEALRVLLPLSIDREPIRRRLEVIVDSVSDGEWSGYGGGPTDDEPRTTLSEAAVFLVTDIEGTIASYSREGHTAGERFEAALFRYEWARSRSRPNAMHLLTLRARMLEAQARDPKMLDEAIEGFEIVVTKLREAVGGGMAFIVSLFEVQFASNLARRGIGDDYSRAIGMMQESLDWRTDKFGADHAFTLVTTGHLIAAKLRHFEDPLGERPIAPERNREAIREVHDTALSLYKERLALFGNRVGQVALALGYLARTSLLLHNASAAVDYAKRSLAAIPDPVPSADALTRPMSQVVLAQARLVEMRLLREEVLRRPQSKRESPEARAVRIAKEAEIREVALELVEQAIPVFKRSLMSERWILRARSLHRIEGNESLIQD